MAKKIVLVVHGGVFHADDVYSAALMCGIAIQRHADFEVLRRNNTDKELSGIPESDDETEVIIADIGRGKFDHHQENAEVRPDGAKYAAFGLLFREFGSELMPDADERAKFDKEFIEPMDLTDNFGQAKYPNERSLDVSAFNSDDPSDMDAQLERFNTAVTVAYTILYYRIHMANKLGEQIKAAKELGHDAIVVTLDDNTGHIPAYLFKDVTPTKFIVEKSLRGGYSMTSVDSSKWPISLDDMTDEVKKECTFVHPSHFMASFKTIEIAQKAAEELALREELKK